MEALTMGQIIMFSTILKTVSTDESCVTEITDWGPGNFKSPKYPQYDANLDCFWNFIVTPGSVIEIRLDDISLTGTNDPQDEESKGCPNDYLEFRDGSTKKSPLLARLCTYPTDLKKLVHVSTGNTMLVHMHTDGANHDRGFLARHTGICDVKLTTKAGILLSPRYPSNYPGPQRCVWIIDFGPGYNVRLEFHTFQLEEQDHGDCYDYVSIQEGVDENAPETEEYCSSELPPVQTTEGPMRINFKSDQDKEFLGFNATYVAFERNLCRLSGACHPNSTCLDTDGFYQCTCAADYIGNGKDCVYRDKAFQIPGYRIGRWSSWKDWIKSNRPCNRSILIGRRSCANPAPSRGGKSCSGESLLIRQELRGTEFPGCFRTLGLEDGRISDSQISASSEWDASHGASYARLNYLSSAWSAKTNDNSQWLKIDVGYVTHVTGIQTQGAVKIYDDLYVEWVNKYTVSFSQDNKTYQEYEQNGTAKEFTANFDSFSIVQQVLSPPILARFIRIHPTSWNGHITMRVEMLGCATDKLLRFNGSSPSFGRVEVNRDNSWKFVCGKQWTTYESSALCKVLGYNGTKDDRNESTTDFISNSTNAQQCEDIDSLIENCTSKKKARVIECTVPVRLAESSVSYTGRAEVFLKGTWGTVCSTGWDRNDADILCRELGFKKAVAEFLSSNISDGTGPILMSDLRCKGSETRLSQCPRAEVITAENCRSAKVYCEPNVGDSQGLLDAKSYSFSIGERATIDCDLEKDQYFGWLDEEGLQTGKEVGESNELIISSVQPSDGGIYQCVGTTKRRIYVIYVAFESSVEPKQSIRINQDGALICKARGKPTPLIQWLKNGKPISSRRFRQMENGTLLVKSVTKHDSGTYICRIRQTFEYVTKEKQEKIQVVVEVPPVVEVDPVSATVVEGQTVMFRCNISMGLPTPQLRWYHKEEVIGIGETLALNVTKQKHEGNYTCNAKNEAGFFNATSTLNVNVPPKIGPLLEKTFVLLNTTLNLTCLPTGSPPFKISWKKDGSKDIQRAVLTNENQSLTVSQTMLNDSGLYQCNASNDVGFATSETGVLITVKPKFEVFQQNKTSVQGDNVTLICNASGVPPPNITWTFDNGALPPSWKRFSNTVLLQNIRNNEEFEGFYTCHAQNREGKIKTTMFLTVDEKPTATITRGLNVTRLVGEKLELKCDVGGDPKPQVKWTKDSTSKISSSKITPPSNTTLLIESVILENDGFYTCRVKNRAGEDYSSSTVRIYDPNTAGKGNGGNANVTGVTKMEMVWAPVVAAILFGVLLFAGWRLKRRCSQDVSYPEVPSATPASAFPPVAPVRRRRPSDPWEVLEEDVVIQGFLGVGAFGEVWRAVVQHVGSIKGNRECAVKKLRVSVSRDTRKKFMKEIELGKMLGSEGHPNIVNFLGCVTRAENPMIIMEYTPHGDLLGFLRKSRGLEDKHHVGENERVKKLENYDLVNFAQQIACGMKFLKYKGIMHRDLAARNVLVGDDFVCKVTDFGLAFQTEKYGYGSAKKGRLPTKWTAPEVLFDNSRFQISSKSDVWSYGIILYEIFTLGGTPYPDFGHNDLIVQLSTKHYRMPKPDHISDNIYEVMMLCWSEDPAGRPSFEELHETFLKMIAQKHYMEVFDEARYENQLYQPDKFASDASSSDDAPETQEIEAARVTVEIEEEAGATAAEAKAVTVQIEGGEEAMEMEAKSVAIETHVQLHYGKPETVTTVIAEADTTL